MFINRLIKNPVETFSGIISAGLLVYALYYMLPMSLNDSGVLSTLFTGQSEHVVIGGILAFIGAYAFYWSFKTDVQRLHGAMFVVMIAWAALTLLRIATLGWFPVGGWLFFWMSCLKSTVCYLYLGAKLSGNRRGR